MASASFPKEDFIFDIIADNDKFISSKQVDDDDDEELVFDQGVKPGVENDDDDEELVFDQGVKQGGESFDFTKYHHTGHVRRTSDFIEGIFDDFQLSPLEPQSVQKGWEDPGVENTEPMKDRRCLSMSSLELLRSHGNRIKKMDGKRLIEHTVEEDLKKEYLGERLSLDEIARLAGMKFIDGSPSGMDVHYALGPYCVAFSCLADEEKQDVQLIELLLFCAENVSCKQYDRARNLLGYCSDQYLKQGTPVQRLVYCFAEALLERIERETGQTVFDDFWKIKELTRDLLIMNSNRSRIACHQELPFSQIVQVMGMQAIIEKVAGAKSVHAIDLCIASGVQWTILMQAMQNSDLQILRITAVGTHEESRDLMEETGKRLKSFAGAINLTFSFKLVIIDVPSDLTEDHFEADPNERLVVYSAYCLRNLIGRRDQLDALMEVIVKLNPLLMVVTEVDSNHNSLSFVERFVEALFFFTAVFDCLETYMERLDENRLALESFYFGEAIRNIVAAEGDERMVRSMKIDVWRAYFARLGIVEDELSPSAMFQASLLVKRFGAEKFCSLDINGKALTITWKNTPVVFLSVWKFSAAP